MWTKKIRLIFSQLKRQNHKSFFPGGEKRYFSWCPLFVCILLFSLNQLNSKEETRRDFPQLLCVCVSVGKNRRVVFDEATVDCCGGFCWRSSLWCYAFLARDGTKLRQVTRASSPLDSWLLFGYYKSYYMFFLFYSFLSLSWWWLPSREANDKYR